MQNFDIIIQMLTSIAQSKFHKQLKIRNQAGKCFSNCYPFFTFPAIFDRLKYVFSVRYRNELSMTINIIVNLKSWCILVMKRTRKKRPSLDARYQNVLIFLRLRLCLQHNFGSVSQKTQVNADARTNARIFLKIKTRKLW